jgi:hypothetical protein
MPLLIPLNYDVMPDLLPLSELWFYFVNGFKNRSAMSAEQSAAMIGNHELVMIAKWTDEVFGHGV